MIVELHDRLSRPVKAPATRVLVTADDGTPVCLLVEYATAPPWIRCFRADDPDFNEQLQMAGVNHTVLVTRANVGTK